MEDQALIESLVVAPLVDTPTVGGLEQEGTELSGQKQEAPHSKENVSQETTNSSLKAPQKHSPRPKITPTHPLDQEPDQVEDSPALKGLEAKFLQLINNSTLD